MEMGELFDFFGFITEITEKGTQKEWNSYDFLG